jgi:hypothetical protein
MKEPFRHNPPYELGKENQAKLNEMHERHGYHSVYTRRETKNKIQYKYEWKNIAIELEEEYERKGRQEQDDKSSTV